MNTATQSVQFEGPAGMLEGLQDEPTDGSFKGIAVIAHPKPFFAARFKKKLFKTLPKPLFKMVGAPFVLIFEV
jgi:alpha/beta superfamily hydrolase